MQLADLDLLEAFHSRVMHGTFTAMNDSLTPDVRITTRLLDSLYTEAMVLADEARHYFDEAGRDERAMLEPSARVGFACESLKVTTRIMHIVAWLLTQRAIASGELNGVEGRRPERRLGHVQDSDQLVVEQLPHAARVLISASAEFYARVRRVDESSIESKDMPISPARALMGRLERRLAGGD